MQGGEEDGIMLAALKMAVVKPPINRNYEDLLLIKTYISKTDFFREIFMGLSLDQIDELCRAFRYESFAQNHVIFQQHAEGDRFYLIIEGSCNISILQKQAGDEFVDTQVHVCKQGDYFGERALQYDEPRAATVRSAELTECLSLSKEVYTEIIKNASENALDHSKDKSSSAARKVLMKKRDFRTPEELLLVATYLDRRVEFFRKFNRTQQLELARVAELLVVKPNVILFKQGQLGQAFYIILSGKVHMHVDSPHEEGATILVNTLGHGGAFGERALESSSSTRTATVSIAETSELLLITSNDYNTIISEMKARERNEKIELLKNSHCFQSLSPKATEEMIRYMEPRNYRLDKLVYKSRTKAMEMIIVSKGDMQIEVELEESGGSKHDVVLGVVGPSTILADYITQCTSFIQDMTYKEKVTSLSLSSVYVINKYDIFFHMSVDTRLELARLVLDSYLKPPSTTLFNNVVQKFGEKDWRIHKSWRIFKKEVTHNLGYQIQDTFKTVGKDPPLEKEASGNLPILPDIIHHKDVLTVSKFHQQENVELEEKGDTAANGGVKTHDGSSGSSSSNNKGQHKHKGGRSDISGSVTTGAHHIDSPVFILVQFHRESIKLRASHLPSSPRLSKMFIQFAGAMHSSEEAQAAANSQLLNYKISNLKFDHKRLHWRPFVDFMSVPIQHTDHFVVYLRSAPIAIASYTPNISFLELDFPEPCKVKAQLFATLFFTNIEEDTGGGGALDSGGFGRSGLIRELQSFVELQAVHGSQVDCLRYAKTTVLKTMSTRADRASIKPCVLPMYNWIHLADDTFTKFDCRNFTVESIQKQQLIAKASKTSKVDLNEFFKSHSEAFFHSSNTKPAHFDQSVTETFSRAGVNRNVHKINFKTDPKDAMIAPMLTLRMLDNEVYRKELSNEVMRNKEAREKVYTEAAGSSLNSNSRVSTSKKSGIGRGSGVGDNMPATSRSNTNSLAEDSVDELLRKRDGPSESIEERLADLNNIIAARQQVIDRNTNLCLIEKFVKYKKKSVQGKEARNAKFLEGSSSSGSQSASNLVSASPAKTGSGSDDIEVIEAERAIEELVMSGLDIPKNINYAIHLSASKKNDPYIMQRAMSSQQYEMLDSINNLQTMKAMKKSANMHNNDNKKGNNGRTGKRINGSSFGSSSISSFPSSASDNNNDNTNNNDDINGDHNTYGGNKRSNNVSRDTKFSLSSKLDVLAEMLETTRNEIQ